MVLKTLLVTEGFFDIFGIQPLAGRFFRPEEHIKGNNRVVVISARWWRAQFNSDPSIVGKTIPLDDGAFLVAGVAPDDFQPHFQEYAPGDRDLYAAKAIEEYEPRIRASGYWNVVGRLKDGVSIEQAQAEMDAVSIGIEQENPRTNKGVRADVITLREHLVGDVRPAVTLFGGAVFAVLLIACVNVTNLLLARGASRQQELAVRTALGASRTRLVAQLLVETLMLASVASIVALFLAHAAMRGLASWGPREVMWIDSLHVDGWAIGFAVLLAFARHADGGPGAGAASLRTRLAGAGTADDDRRPIAAASALGAGDRRGGDGADARLGHRPAAAQLRQPAERRHRLHARQRDGHADVRVGSEPGPGGAAQLPGSRHGEGRRHSRRRAGRRRAGHAVHRVEHRHPGRRCGWSISRRRSLAKRFARPTTSRRPAISR